MKMIQIFLFLVVLSLFGCDKAAKNQIIYATEIYSDFPTSEKLELKFFNKYNIKEFGYCFMDDSILWYTEGNENNLGHCYNLNTGEKLSVIGTIGKASYEFLETPAPIFFGDSVQFYTHEKNLKIFSKKDIIENKPMSERAFSVVDVPDSLSVLRMIKLQNGNTVATVGRSHNPIQIECKLNERDLLLFNDKEAKSYNTIRYTSFENGHLASTKEDENLRIKDQIKYAFAGGNLIVRDNDLAVFFASNQFIFYTFDLKKGKTLKEKRYSNIKATDQTRSFGSRNDLQLRIEGWASNDKYIMYWVQGYFSAKEKEAKLKKNAIFVFDWNLNPIKRYDLPKLDMMNYYKISNDCNSVYMCKYSENGEDGLILYKADIKL